MGKKNSATKKYMEDNLHFADVFNYVMYNGEQIIQPEQLKEQDSNELIGILTEGKGTYIKEKYRDILKECVIKNDKKRTYLMMGIENQSDIHYAMPVRNMLYDALNYASQVDKIALENREKGNLTSESFLSGFSAYDKIKPVITLVMYWNSKEWTAPRCLYDMFENVDDNVRKFISDYKINILVPKEISDVDKFKTDLSSVIEFIKVSDDKQKLKRLVDEKSDVFEAMSKSAAMVLKECANIKINQKGSGKVNMCKAIEDMMEDVRVEEREKAEEEKLNLMVKYCAEGFITVDKALEDVGVSKERFLEALDNYNK